MKISDVPDRFPIPFAASAGGGYTRAIPEASQIGIQNGAASLTDGFPPLNFLPVGAGGVPPFGQDMNGILNQITLWNQWQAAGSLVPYDVGFSSDIGGYPQGVILSGTASGVVWLNLVDDNTSNPDTGGANWVQIATATSAQTQTETIVTQRIQNFIIIGDQKTSGTAGGTFTSAAWRQRDLQTVISDPQGFIGSGTVALSGNQVTLTAGLWLVEASAPALGVDGHKTRLQNITDSTTTAYGTTEQTTAIGTADQVQTRSQVVASFTLAATKVFQLQHVAITTSATIGFGIASDYGLGANNGTELYSIFKATKLSQ